MRKQKDDFITFYDFKLISLFLFFFHDNNASGFIIFLVDSFDVLLLFFFFNQSCFPFFNKNGNGLFAYTFLFSPPKIGGIK